MNNEKNSSEIITTQDAAASPESSPVAESPEDLSQEYIAKSNQEAVALKSDAEDDLAYVETVAKNEHLTMSSDDEAAFLELENEVEIARDELISDLSIDSNDSSNGSIKVENKTHHESFGAAKEIIPASTIRTGREVLHRMYATGKGETPLYHKLNSMLVVDSGGQGKWKTNEEIDNSELELLLKDIDQVESFDAGKSLLLKLDSAGNNTSSEFLNLYSCLVENTGVETKWKSASEIDAEKIKKIIEVIQGTQKKSIEDYSAMNERVVEEPQLLSEREASKKFLTIERASLAQEIRELRKKQRERIVNLRYEVKKLDSLMDSQEAGETDRQYDQLVTMQSSETNEMSDRLRQDKHSDADAQEENETLTSLIASSDGMQALKLKLEGHYANADSVVKSKYETVLRSVEQTLIRNNVFVVHAIKVDERNRHNSNSNISSRATIDDDINILLSLEPSVSASSLVPGVRQGLWENGIGVVLGGGYIKSAQFGNGGSTTVGLERGDAVNSSVEIDTVVSDKGERGYNELVVNNPKVFGFYQNVRINTDGKMVGFEKTSSAKNNTESKVAFMRHMNTAAEKGMPLMIMTPD